MMSVQKLLESVKDMEIVELGQYLEENMPVHPSQSKFFKTKWHSMEFGDVCNDYQIIMNEHNGTHVDSFGHYIDKTGYQLIDKISVDKFCGACITIDARFLKEKETLEKQHIMQWEEKNGPILKGEIVLIDFGWARYWKTKPNNKQYIYNYPGIGATGAAYLVEKKVKLVGVDTLSVDAFGADNDPAHNTLLANKILVAENINNLNKLYGKKGYFIMLPLLIKDGSGSPVRPIVLI
jgi:kynurenine formamidase